MDWAAELAASGVTIVSGAAYGIDVACQPERWTRVAIRVPVEDELVPC